MPNLRTSSFFEKGIGRHLQSSSELEKFDLVRRIWPSSHLSVDDFDSEAYINFFQYLGDELEPLYHHQFQFAAETFESTSDLIYTLSDNRSQSLSALLELTGKRFLNVDEAALQRSIELSVRLWLTINVNSATLSVGPINGYECPVDWPRDDSLENLIHRQFLKAPDQLNSNVKSRIDPAFTAAYLINICGLRIRWTNTFSDHLRFDRKGQTLAVYKHKICLFNHLKAKGSCPIPSEVLEEALDTLNLLFPFGDSSTKQLLSRQILGGFYSLGNCNRDRTLDLTRYKYWREELSDLIEAFNEPPKSWRQLLIDSRNMKDWATFWIGVMVLLLTLVSIPCNIIQTIYTVKAYNVALQQMKTTGNG